MDILEKERIENEKNESDEEAKRRNEEMEKIIIANSLIMFLAGTPTIYIFFQIYDWESRLAGP